MLSLLSPNKLPIQQKHPRNTETLTYRMSKASTITQQVSLGSSVGADQHGAVSDGAEGGPRHSTGQADRVQRLTSRHDAKDTAGAGTSALLLCAALPEAVLVA